jgi:hypothetical protein
MDEPAEMYVPSVIPRDLRELACLPGVRELAEDFDKDDTPLWLEAALPVSYTSCLASGALRFANRWKGDRWSSSLSEMPISRGTELDSDSEV